MRLFFIILFLCSNILACKKESNKSSLDSVKKNLVISSQPFVTIMHEEYDSFLRIKLLAHALYQELNLHLENNELANLQSSDLFKFKSKTYSWDAKKEAEYIENSLRSVQVVISLEDRIKIHFLPTGISSERAMQLLGINNDLDAKFYFINSDDKILEKNKIYYFVKGSKRQIKENDIFWFEEQKILGPNFLNTKIQFSNNQIFRLKIKAEIFERETFIEMLTGKKRRCMPGEWEAGTCTECEYQMENSAPRFKLDPINGDLSDLSIDLNGKIMALKNMPAEKDKEGNFLVTINLKKMYGDGLTTMELIHNYPAKKYKNVSGFGYATGCQHRNVNRDIDITPDYRYEVKIDVLGRYLDF